MVESSTQDPEAWIAELSCVAESDARRALLERNAKEKTPELAQQLYDEALRLIRIDLDRADHVAEALLWATEHLDIDRTRGQALRMGAHIRYLRGDHELAVTAYAAAQAVFDKLGDEVESARTISAAIHSLIYLDRYSQALTLADRARVIFEKYGDHLRLARLDVNVGNLFYRQDRFAEALASYRRACGVLQTLGDAQDVAIVLRNMAVSELGLSNFDRALEIYREAREFTEKHDLPLLLSEADYNIAYLYFLRGEYTQAVELYEAARTRCNAVGDVYHRSLCDLDQSEIYLEVNLVEEADVLAADALDGFDQLGMKYESAKALTFRALAANRLGKRDIALAWLSSARNIFAEQKNRLWPALIDFYKAVILFEEDKHNDARELCSVAQRRFRAESMNGKAALCELLLARIDQSENKLRDAKLRCSVALALLRGVEAPPVTFQAHLLLGQVLEAMGDKREAFTAYTAAHLQLESLRNQVHLDEIKISFLKNKLSVYEGLVALCLEAGDEAKAFDFIERAKSRSLADTMASRAHALRPKSQVASDVGARQEANDHKLATLRYQRRREEMRTETADESSGGLIDQPDDAEVESGVEVMAGAWQDPQLELFGDSGAVRLNALQAALGQDAVVLEYYEARGKIVACVVSQESLKIVPVAMLDDVRRECQFLDFQLSKFRFGPEYVDTFSALLQQSVDGHLRALYEALIAPVRNELRAKHLVIVPHGIMHRLPFHALTDGERYLVDDYSISYAPSAGIHHLCSLSVPAATQDSLVLGVPDAIAPDIFGEANAVASILPSARVFLGEDATVQCLFENAPSSRVIHVASHGHFHDNPMFSCIGLADATVGLFEFYELRLDAELVTLSGCGTGLNVVVGGDELIGLVRALLHAGARSVLATLWDVNDATTATFMTSFYRKWGETANRGLAMQWAMRELRDANPHPYYWAPFALTGKHA